MASASDVAREQVGYHVWVDKGDRHHRTPTFSDTNLARRTASTLSRHHPHHGGGKLSFVLRHSEIGRFSAQMFAEQITIIFMRAFAAIPSEEFMGMKWAGRRKAAETPCIYAFDQCFNHLTYLVQSAALDAESLDRRVDILAYFVRVAHQLVVINNLAAARAVLAALQSGAIERLRHTWEQTYRHNSHLKDIVQRLGVLFSMEDNFAALRQHTSSLQIPCIPFLGVFNKDLIYIETATPSTGGLEPLSKRDRINNILRIISEFQRSTYAFAPVPQIQSYLAQSTVIDELSEFSEKHFFEKSLEIEPKQTVSAPSPSVNTIKRGHRKCSSLGSSSQFAVVHRSEITVTANCVSQDDSDVSSRKPHLAHQRSLIDGSILPVLHPNDDTSLSVNVLRQPSDASSSKSPRMRHTNARRFDASPHDDSVCSLCSDAAVDSDEFDAEQFLALSSSSSVSLPVAACSDDTDSGRFTMDSICPSEGRWRELTSGSDGSVTLLNEGVVKMRVFTAARPPALPQQSSKSHVLWLSLIYMAPNPPLGLERGRFVLTAHARSSPICVWPKSWQRMKRTNFKASDSAAPAYRFELDAASLSSLSPAIPPTASSQPFEQLQAIYRSSSIGAGPVASFYVTVQHGDTTLLVKCPAAAYHTWLGYLQRAVSELQKDLIDFK